MSENTNKEHQTQGENEGKESGVKGVTFEDTGGKKLFTQDEVNSIIQERLGRMRNQATKEVQAEYSKKLADLEAREMKFKLREGLADRGLPKELAEVVACSDDDDLAAKLDLLQGIYRNNNTNNAPHENRSAGMNYNPASGSTAKVDNVRVAMGLKG